MTPTSESLIKTDQIGRLRYTPEQRKSMVDAYRASGLSAPRFATHHGVSYQTLISWIKKEKQPAASTSQNPPPFFSVIPVVIEDSATSTAQESMEIILSGSITLRINSTKQVALAVALISQLQHTTPC